MAGAVAGGGAGGRVGLVRPLAGEDGDETAHAGDGGSGRDRKRGTQRGEVERGSGERRGVHQQQGNRCGEDGGKRGGVLRVCALRDVGYDEEVVVVWNEGRGRERWSGKGRREA